MTTARSRTRASASTATHANSTVSTNGANVYPSHDRVAGGHQPGGVAAVAGPDEPADALHHAVGRADDVLRVQRRDDGDDDREPAAVLPNGGSTPPPQVPEDRREQRQGLRVDE